jgi:hypothetical protein
MFDAGRAALLSDHNARTTVPAVVAELIRHPFRSLILRWNWKSAVLSAALRAPIFFFVYFFGKSGLGLALGAFAVQALLRLFIGGVNGAIIQSFRRVEPAWHALITVPLVLATVSHVFEFIVQSIYDHQTGVTGKGRAIAISVLISATSALFNLFAMRRGALLVKDEKQQSIWRDLRRMPRILVEFIALPVVWSRRNRKKKTD